MVSLFFNGKIWQWSNDSNLQSPEDRYAHWFTVCDEGMVHQVGRGSPTDELTSQTTSVIDLHGSLVIPGLHDSHIHAYFLGESSEYLNLTGCKSYDDFIQRLQEYEAKYPKKSWIVGYGWEQDSLSADGRYPSRKDIDDVIKNRPVLLYRACWHIIVVNTKALEVAGVDISQKQWNVESGAVDVDKNGPTGIFREAVSGYHIPLSRN
jgi:predicted amidohydrolase YtcJ